MFVSGEGGWDSGQDDGQTWNLVAKLSLLATTDRAEKAKKRPAETGKRFGLE